LIVTWPGREAPIDFSSASGAATKASSREVPIGRSSGDSAACPPSSRRRAPGSRPSSASRGCFGGVAAGAAAFAAVAVVSAIRSQSTEPRKRTELIPSAIA
jgi:hypothetical protein